MVLGKLPVPGRPTILITVGQGPIALAVGVGGGGLDIFTFIYPFSSFSLSFGRLKYCLKGPLNPKQQPTNHCKNRISPKNHQQETFFFNKMSEKKIAYHYYLSDPKSFL